MASSKPQTNPADPPTPELIASQEALAAARAKGTRLLEQVDAAAGLASALDMANPDAQGPWVFARAGSLSAGEPLASPKEMPTPTTARSNLALQN